MILYELCCGTLPFPATNWGDLVNRVTNHPFVPLPDHLEQSTKDLITALLTKDPKNRPSIEEVLKMPIIFQKIKIIAEQAVFGEEIAKTVRD